MRSHEDMMDCGDDGLEALVSAVVRSAEPMPEVARAQVRGRLLAAIGPSAVPLHVRLIRPAVALVTVGSLLGGVSYAAAESRPGEPLFGLKQSIVSTVQSANRVLSRHTAGQRVPAVFRPVEAPAGTAPESAPAPRLREASPKETKAGPTPPGKAKAKGQGNGNAGSKPKGQKGHGPTHGRMRGSSRGGKV